MKLRFLYCFLFTSVTVLGQDNVTYNIDFTDPKSVLESIFYAAQKRDLSILQCLCDPLGESEKEIKGICGSSKYLSEIEEKDRVAKMNEFVNYFENGKVNGVVTFELYNGKKLANVPFHFNHPMGEARSNEVMQLINRYGNWYLYKF